MTESERPELNPAVFEALWTYSTDLLSIVSEDGVTRYASPSYAGVVGYDPAELVGTSIYSRIHPDDVESVRTGFSTAMRSHEPVTMRVRYRHKNGSWRVLEVIGTNHLDDQLVRGFVVNGRDITDRVEAETVLEQRVEERTRELTTLLDVSRTIASSLDLERLLTLVLDALQQLVGYEGASISVVDGEDLVIVVGRPESGGERPASRRTPFRERSAIWDYVARNGPQIIDDVEGDEPMARFYRETARSMGQTDLGGFHSWLSVPLLLKDQVMGVMSLIHRERHAFSAHQADLIAAVGQQLAVAIENVHLYQRAQEAAVIEERQRLSRELHDSVSQALYSVGLGGKTARAVVESDPARAIEALDFTLAQAERGLAEMRALIFELRPESLEQEGLVAALQRQTAALEARHQTAIALSVPDEPDASLAVKEALYRVAQEALHNAFKHAGPRALRVSLWCDGDDIVLEVLDDGQGFDPSQSFPGHLGLQSMRERIARRDGTLSIESAPGSGTRVRARVPRFPEDSAGPSLSL